MIFSFPFFIQTIDGDDHGQEKKHLIDQGKYTLAVGRRQQQQRRTLSAMNLFSSRSTDETAQDNLPLVDQNSTTDLNTGDRPRRARSMLNETKCAPS